MFDSTIKLDVKSKSILQRTYKHVLEHPNRSAFVFLGRNNHVESSLTWHDLWESALKVASILPITGKPNECGIMVFCQNEERFIIGLLAVWLRGATVMPAAGGLRFSMFERNAHILKIGSPEIILHDHKKETLNEFVFTRAKTILCNIDDGLTASILNTHPTNLDGGGMVQFTSGSTSDPKPVKLDAHNIAANCSAIESAFDLGYKTVGVHWLPLYHDMGLVGSVLVPLWSGALSVIQKPSSFIQRPMDWFKAISKWRGTITSAPNFAYAKIIKAAENEDISLLDLSCIETMIFGGESVQKTTTEQLLRAFSSSGLAHSAIAPCYGLAEVTLLASSGKNANGPCFDSTVASRPIANVGRPIKGLCIQVVDSVSKKVCIDSQIGLIKLTGSSVGAVIENGDDWRYYKNSNSVQTSDLGYLQNGFLYVTGRSTNKIIIRGKNIYAEDIEEIVLGSQLDQNILGVVAFATTQEGTEGLCVLLEYDHSGSQINLDRVNECVGRRLGVKVSKIVVLRRSTLPRTSSGKIQRDVAVSKFRLGGFDNRMVENE